MGGLFTVYIFFMLLYTDLYFLVLWLGEEDAMYDVRDLVLPEGVATLEISEGDLCKAPFQGKLFDVEVIAKGTKHSVTPSVNIDCMHLTSWHTFILHLKT